MRQRGEGEKCERERRTDDDDFEGDAHGSREVLQYVNGRGAAVGQVAREAGDEAHGDAHAGGGPSHG